MQTAIVSQCFKIRPQESPVVLDLITENYFFFTLFSLFHSSPCEFFFRLLYLKSFLHLKQIIFRDLLNPTSRARVFKHISNGNSAAEDQNVEAAPGVRLDLRSIPDRWICQSPLRLSNYSICRQEADDYLALLFFPLLILHCHESDTN